MSTTEPYLSVPEALQLLSQSGTIIDIRPEQHFLAGHIPGSRRIDVEQLTDNPLEAVWGADPLAMLDPDIHDKTVLVISFHPIHARAMVTYLRSQGLNNAYTLKNGLQEWIDDGQFLIPGPERHA